MPVIYWLFGDSAEECAGAQVLYGRGADNIHSLFNFLPVLPLSRGLGEVHGHRVGPAGLLRNSYFSYHLSDGHRAVGLNDGG